MHEDTCKKSKRKHCNEFFIEDCKKIFNEYWEAGYKGMQDTFIHSHVHVMKMNDPKNHQGNSRCDCSKTCS